VELSGRTAVVTGAASGIGFALVERFGAEGMRVVLADVETAALDRAVATLEARGVRALGVRTDVTRLDQVEALADAAEAAFGAVHVVCNNAGVFAGGLSWEVPLDTWDWVLGVNLWGVVHGVHTFVPRLLAHGDDAHVVNTASMAGLVSNPLAAPYTVSKFGVVALSETLHHELALRGARVGVSVLCPEGVATRIGESARNRPGGPRAGDPSPDVVAVEAALRAAIEHGLAPRVMADRVVRAIRERRFYVLAEDDWRRAADLRCEDVRLARNPSFAPPRPPRG
jgi:NAD(P)-dependent dehydrogenase (short-subunit alcohol dehydrogenase family)